MVLLRMSVTAATVANTRAINAFDKGQHDDLNCTSLKDLAVQLAAKHKGAEADTILTWLAAHPECYERVAGVYHRVPRPRRGKKAAARLQAVSA